jgi:hypothetical protein
VRPHFVSRLLYNSPLRLHVRSLSATMSHRYDGTTMGPLSTRPPSPLVPLSSHPSPFHWTTSQSRGSSLVTAVANKNLDDVMCIPALWDVEAVCNRITLTPFFLLLLYNPIASCFCLLFFFANCYRISTVIYISCLSSQCSGKGSLGSSRCIDTWSKFLTVCQYTLQEAFKLRMRGSRVGLSEISRHR